MTIELDPSWRNILDKEMSKPYFKDLLHYIDEEYRVMDGISWGKDVQLIINRIENRMIDLNDVIFFQGYSGWDINQLNEEISGDNWIVLDESDLNIFEIEI